MIQEPGDRPSAVKPIRSSGLKTGVAARRGRPALRPDEPALTLSLPTLLLLAQAPPVYEDGYAVSEQVLVEDDRPEGPDPQRTPASVTVLPVDESVSSNADVASLLEAAPGVAVQRMGGLGDWSSVSIRGSTLRQVQVYLDGVPLNPDGASTVNLSELPLAAFSRVELYRGSAPPELAASPLGGVVNLVTGEHTPPPVLSAGAGSFVTQRAFVSAGADSNKGVTPVDGWAALEIFRTQGNFEAFDDNGTTYNLIDDHLTVRQNNQKLQANAHSRLRLGTERLRLTVLDALLGREEGLPGNVDAPATSARLSTTRNLLVTDLSGGGEQVRATARVYGWWRQEILDDRLGELGTGNQWTDDTTRCFSGMASARWGLAPWLSPALTLSGRRDSYRSIDLLNNEEGPRRGRSAYTATLSAMSWWWSDQLAFAPVVQVMVLDNRDLSPPGEVASPIPASSTARLTHADPRLGVLLRPWPALTLKANGGTALRPPDFNELFGDRGVVVGNPDLVPEHGWSADLGARWTLPELWQVGWTAEVTGFTSHTHDLISYVQTGQRVLVPLNIGESRARGVEAGVELSWRGLESRTGLTWTDSENLSENPQVQGKQLPRVPEWDLYQTVSWDRDGRLSSRVAYTLNYTDGNYWDATNWYRSAPRLYHGLMVRVQPGLPGLSVEAEVLNLTNRLSEVVPRDPLDPGDDSLMVQATTDMSGYPLPGRSVFVNVRWSPAARDPKEEKP